MQPTRHRMWGLIAFLVFGGPLAGSRAASASPPSEPLKWAEPTEETRPWTRWWWMGSAVDRPNLTRMLEQFKAAGIGGVEICPIYGAKGYENQFIDYLSPKWMEMFDHTTAEAKRLGMGVDLTTGTGWPNGGPTVTVEEASSRVVMKSYDVAGGAKLSDAMPDGKLRCLVAISKAGEQVDLTDKLSNGKLDWTAPAGQWRVYAVAQRGPLQKVKRAAPGGVGSVLDPYSVTAMDKYLAWFDQAFAGYHGAMPRAFFHDSFEYYGASWTNDFFEQFAKLRGYDLRKELPAFFGEGDADKVSRVVCDYRETISDLHLAYINRWTEWAHGHGSLSRNQAHGSPTNLVDTYAAADIPETEVFGSIDEKNIPLNKFSSSAAHVSGRKLSSSESFTWLTDHFQASLSDVKQAADYLFLTGVNHIFFHGIPYSPSDAAWPGWQFYAAVNFGPQGGLWHNLPEFNAYVARCQSVLQSGKPANDVLLYLPVYDKWSAGGNPIESNPMPASFTAAALLLWDRGYAFDHLSDRVLQKATFADGSIQLGGNTYRAILVPACKVMPDATLQRLADLAHAGATVIFEKALPSDVPGLSGVTERQAKLHAASASIAVGKGTAFMGDDIDALLTQAHVHREALVDLGLRYIRRVDGDSYSYFIANRSSKAVDGWIKLGVPAKSAVLLDPRSGDRAGIAALSTAADDAAQVYLQLQPGESCILRTFAQTMTDGPHWAYVATAGAPVPVGGNWDVKFVEGGPALPATYQTDHLSSWSTLADDVKHFSGTAVYTIQFDRPADGATDWLLDLGRVGDSARVKLNGHEIGGLWCAPFNVPLGSAVVSGKNTLEVEVTNLALNRIEDMDQRGVKWKYFYDVNMASKGGRGVFDASNLPPRNSGLIGPVQLIPLKAIDPSAK